MHHEPGVELDHDEPVFDERVAEGLGEAGRRDLERGLGPVAIVEREHRVHVFEEIRADTHHGVEEADRDVLGDEGGSPAEALYVDARWVAVASGVGFEARHEVRGLDLEDPIDERVGDEDHRFGS